MRVRPLHPPGAGAAAAGRRAIPAPLLFCSVFSPGCMTTSHRWLQPGTSSQWACWGRQWSERRSLPWTAHHSCGSCWPPQCPWRSRASATCDGAARSWVASRCTWHVAPWRGALGSAGLLRRLAPGGGPWRPPGVQSKPSNRLLPPLPLVSGGAAPCGAAPMPAPACLSTVTYISLSRPVWWCTWEHETGSAEFLTNGPCTGPSDSAARPCSSMGAKGCGAPPQLSAPEMRRGCARPAGGPTVIHLLRRRMRTPPHPRHANPCLPQAARGR